MEPEFRDGGVFLNGRGIKKMTRFALLFALLAWIFISDANAGDGNSLLKRCSLPLQKEFQITTPDEYADTSASIGYCYGLIEGISSLARAYQAGVLLNKVYGEQLFCLPVDVKNEQMLRVVVKYLENNPSILHKRDSLLAIMSFKEAFPCEKEPSSLPCLSCPPAPINSASPTWKDRRSAPAKQTSPARKSP